MTTEKKDLQLALANPLSVDGLDRCIAGRSFGMAVNNSSMPFYNMPFDNGFDQSNLIISEADFQDRLIKEFENLSTDRDDFKLQKEISEVFTPNKKHSEVVANTYEYLRDRGKDISENRIIRVWNCGNYLGFAHTDDGYKLREANFCRDRLCPQCQRRKSLKMFSQLSRIIDFLVSHKADFGSLKFGLMTFTIKNCDFGDLSQGIDTLINGFRNMTHDNKRLSRLFRKGIIAGVFRSIEITYNEKTNTWHPHMHCIFAFTPMYFKKGNYLKTHEWSDLWQEATGSEDNSIVDARMIRNYQKDKNETVSVKDLEKGIKEASKYCVKGSDFIDPEDIDLTRKKTEILLDALSGRKLYGFTGCFLKARKLLHLDDIEDGDLIHTDETQVNCEIAEQIRRFRWSGYGYTEI